MTITLTLSNEQAATLLEACKRGSEDAAATVCAALEGGWTDTDALDRLIALGAVSTAIRQATD